MLVYRGVYPEPDRSRLRADLREYARYVIDTARLPKQKKIIPKEGTDVIWKFQDHLTAFQPGMYSESIIHSEALGN